MCWEWVRYLEAVVNTVLVVSVACFVLRAEMMLVPLTVSVPAIDVLPYTVRAELSVAAPSHISSRVAAMSRP